MTDYPEHDKLTKVNDQTQAIGEFLTWASNQGYWLMSHGRTTWTDTQACRVCVHTSTEGAQRCKAGKRCPQCQGTHVRQVERAAEGWVQAPMFGVLLAQYAGIDPVVLEAEKYAMLADLRASHGG
jgi:hypothetical protein